MKKENKSALSLVGISALIIIFIVINKKIAYGEPVNNNVLGLSTSTLEVVNTDAASDTIKIANVNGLGDIMTDEQGQALYYYKKDTKGSIRSVCVNACTRKWIPFFVTNTIISGPLKYSDFKSFKRADGAWQITYQGKPLYKYSQDLNSGEVLGHEIDGLWFVATPNVASTTL